MSSFGNHGLECVHILETLLCLSETDGGIAATTPSKSVLSTKRCHHCTDPYPDLPVAAVQLIQPPVAAPRSSGEINTLPLEILLTVFEQLGVAKHAARGWSKFRSTLRLTCKQWRWTTDAAILHMAIGGQVEGVTIPSHHITRLLSKLRNLTRCNLLSCSGLATASALAAISPSVARLKLLWCDLAVLPDVPPTHTFARLTKLNDLTLSKCINVRDGTLAAVGLCKNLCSLTLELSRSEVQGRNVLQLPALTGLTKLSLLEEGGGKVVDPGLTADVELEALAQLTNLRNLSVTFALSLETFLALESLTQLTHLEVFCRYVTDDNVALIQSLPSLQWLHLQTACLTPDSLGCVKHLTALSYLSLGSVQVSKREDVATLAGISQLATLGLTCSRTLWKNVNFRRAFQGWKVFIYLGLTDDDDDDDDQHH